MQASNDTHIPDSEVSILEQAIRETAAEFGEMKFAQALVEQPAEMVKAA